MKTYNETRLQAELDELTRQVSADLGGLPVAISICRWSEEYPNHPQSLYVHVEDGNQSLCEGGNSLSEAIEKLEGVLRNKLARNREKVERLRLEAAERLREADELEKSLE